MGEQIGIHIDVPLKAEIEVPVQVSITDEELTQLEQRTVHSPNKRRELIGKYYFIFRQNMEHIAKTVGVTQSYVTKEVRRIRRGLLVGIKKDLQTNKKLLEHMIDLMIQIDQQTRTTWEKYFQLEDDLNKVRETIDLMKQRVDQLASIPKLNKKQYKQLSTVSYRLSSLITKLFNIHGQQQSYLNLLRQQTQSMLQIWDRFGLTGEDAVKIIMTGGVDIDVRIQEVRRLVVKMVSVVKAEVKDHDQRQRIFAQLANEVKASGVIEEMA